MPLHATAIVPSPRQPSRASTEAARRPRQGLLIVAAGALWLLASMAVAGTEEGVAAFEAGNYEKALEELKPAAERGDTEALYYLGGIYSRGLGVKQDKARGRGLYRGAAQQGHAGAQASLGYIYARGENGSTNYSKAVKWYRQAAWQDHAIAQRNLGLMYKEGEGVDKDGDTAAEWFRQAADQGDGVAQTELGQMYWMGRGVEEILQESTDWLRKAAQADHAKAQSLLCSKHVSLHPQHAPELVRAMMWCKLAADQGYPGSEQMWDGSSWLVTDERKKEAARRARQRRDQHGQ